MINFKNVLLSLILITPSLCSGADIKSGLVILDFNKDPSEKLSTAWQSGCDDLGNLLNRLAVFFYAGVDNLSLKAEKVGDLRFFYKILLKQGRLVKGEVYFGMHASDKDQEELMKEYSATTLIPEDAARNFYSGEGLQECFRYIGETFLGIKYRGVAGCRSVGNVEDLGRALDDAKSFCAEGGGACVGTKVIDLTDLDELLSGMTCGRDSIGFVSPQRVSALDAGNSKPSIGSLTLKKDDAESIHYFLVTGEEQAKTLSDNLKIYPSMSVAGAAEMYTKFLQLFERSLPVMLADGTAMAKSLTPPVAETRITRPVSAFVSAPEGVEGGATTVERGEPKKRLVQSVVSGVEETKADP